MEIILQENFPSLGYVGDKVSVRGGYARNFLIPRGIAVESSKHSEKLLKHRMQHIMAKRLRMRSEAEALAKQLAEVSLEFTLRMSDGGKSFGSITTKDIEAMLVTKGHKIDRRQIKLTDTIRKTGDYKASVKLHPEVNAEITIKVSSEVQETKPSKTETKRAKAASGKPRKTTKAVTEETVKAE